MAGPLLSTQRNAFAAIWSTNRSMDRSKQIYIKVIRLKVLYSC